jgi:alcohol dehydrogenase (cytochrome c)
MRDVKLVEGGLSQQLGRDNFMSCRPQAMAAVWIALGLLISQVTAVQGADPEINQLLQNPVARSPVTNGANLTNQRYSTLEQIDTTNVKQLKGAWVTRLKRSGFGTKYSAEATPLVKDGIMYMITGNDDVLALNAKTGEIVWQRWSWIDQKDVGRMLRLAEPRAGNG